MSTEPFNIRRWHEPGTYEVWYLTWNDPATDQGFWLRYLSEAPVSGPARGELWFARFDPKDPRRTFGIHQHFDAPVDGEHPFAIGIGNAQLGHDHAIGEFDRVRWDLHWQPAERVLRHLPDFVYARGNLGVTSVLSPNPRVPLSGTVTIDGETITFDRAVAGQTHVWGKKHATSWTWGRCADFAAAPDAVLELIGVHQKRGVQLPRMAWLALDLDGEQHRFTQFRHAVRNRATWRGCDVEVTAQNLSTKVEVQMTCRPEDMVVAPYLDPDGEEVFCSNTEIGDALVRVYKRVGVVWREHRVLVGKRRAHFELGGRTRDPAIACEHRLVE